MKFAVSIFALLSATVGVHAADLVVEAVPEVYAPTYDFGGVIEGGVSGTYTENDSDPFEGGAAGAYISGAISGGSDSFLWGVDGFADFIGFETADEAPTYSALIGAHLAFGDETARLGVFASGGVLPDNDDDVGYGYAAGIEGLATFDAVSLFGQLGYARINTDDEGDEESGMYGPFARVGAVYAASDDFALMADLGYGYSEEFTDEDDPGYYYAASVKGALRLTDDLFVTAGYDYGYHYSIDDDDTANTHTVKVGLALPFGGSSTAADVLNPLATSTQPYRGATFGGILD